MRRAFPYVSLMVATVVLQLSGEIPTDPPAPRVRVSEATLEPLSKAVPGGNAVLRVRFAQTDSPPPPRLEYATEHGIVVLADDGKGMDAKAGDGLYTALGSMDLMGFRDRLVRLAGSTTAMPTRVFATRAKVAVDARLDPQQWRPGIPLGIEPWGDPAAIDADRSLLIRDLGVVEDATRTRASCGQASMGVWSFGHLMEQVANTPVTGVTGAQFTRAWLDLWLTEQVVNGWSVSPRWATGLRLLDPWIAASGGPDMPLDLSRAPFRLLAIVNRVDLRHQAAYGGSSGGQLRFVFMFMAPGEGCRATPFQVIFEFTVPAVDCMDQQAWARRWKDLDRLPIGTPAYNAALEAITQHVVAANAAPGRPNGSALQVIRTNESHLAPLPEYGGDWEFREFVVDARTHRLRMGPLAQTPAYGLSDATQIAPYVNGHAAAIDAGTHVVPLTYPAGLPFRAGSLIYPRFSYRSAPEIADPHIRHRFSIATCDGCHGAETLTNFSHVGTAPIGTPAPLSGFLTGIWAPDPVDVTPVRHFADLERRAADLDAFVNTPCFVSPLDLPLFASH